MHLHIMTAAATEHAVQPKNTVVHSVIPNAYCTQSSNLFDTWLRYAAH